MHDPSVRRPTVAGRFYPGDPQTLERDLGHYTAPEPAAGETRENAIGCVVPHAGYVYSGHVAGAVYRRLPARSCFIILGPNHFGRGEPLAVMSQGEWLTPLGPAAIDADLARALHHAFPLLTEDPVAHSGEHSLEVQVPFLQHLTGKFTFVPIAVGVSRYAALESLGHGLARAIASRAERPFIIASSDMNHYEPDATTRTKDRKAIERILDLDPQGLYDVLQREDISMCGYGPAIAMLTAAKDLGATAAELVKYATSADTSGDTSAVVGYAGIIVY
jgi:MEMO1 family protein